ncbi:MAG: hypothetical protein ACLU38_09655 [Dysosmobacter sp.]
MLPLLAKKDRRFDPAVMASPFITTHRGRPLPAGSTSASPLSCWGI